jgi:hypothetical protein
MATSSFYKFNSFVEHLAEKVHDLGADSLKYYLTNATPDAAADSIKADLAEISTGNGYTGPQTLTISSSAQSSGTYKLTLADPSTITASGGSIAQFRYAVFYNDTPTSPADPLIGYWDYGSGITLGDGETFNLDLDQTNGVLTVA